MGKSLHRRKQSEQDRVNWRWGLVNMFAFRRGGSIHRFHSAKRLGNKVLSGDEFSQDAIRNVKEFEYHQPDDADFESSRSKLPAGKQSVEKVMQEKTVIEDNRKQNSKDLQNQDSDLERDNSTDYQRKRIHLSVSSAMEFTDLANDAYINHLVREIFIRIQQKRVAGVELGQKDGLCHLPEKSHGKIVKQLIEATKVILHEKLIYGTHLGRDGKIHYSREFMDAVVTLISHKDLFFKLLEDPTSELTSRINKLLNAELGKIAGQNESERTHHRKESLFSRSRVRSQSQDLVVQLDSGSSESPCSNAILDSGLEALSTSNSVNSSMSRLKTKSFFSFFEIKRRLKQAMGKNREEVSMKHEVVKRNSGGGQFFKSGGETVGRMSPSKNPHLEVEIHPKRLSGTGSESGSMDRSDMTLELWMGPEKNMSSNYVEPNKLSSQILTDEDGNEKFSTMQNLELARNSFSTPGHTRSPTPSSTTQSSCISPTSHITSSSPRKSLSSNEDSQALEWENNADASVDLSAQFSDTFIAELESQNPSPIISDQEVFGDSEGESHCYVEMSSSGDVKDMPLQIEEITTQHMSTKESTETGRSSATVEDEGEIEELHEPVSIADCDEQEGKDEDCEAPSQSISEASYLGSDKTQQPDDVTIRMERPSPISVLEPVHLEGEISPLSTNTLRGELPVTPLQIHFEEIDLSESDSDKSTVDKKSSNDNDSRQKYIKEILTASDFSWDTLYIRSLSSDQLLDTYIHSDESFSEYKLLYDCLNEVLMDCCTRYFGCSPLTPLAKPNIRPIPDTENAFQEIWEGVELHLRPLSPHIGFEQIVNNDLVKDGRWMDLRYDVNTIGTEIENLIIQELIEDTVLSCFSDEDDVIAIPAESSTDSTGLN